MPNCVAAACSECCLAYHYGTPAHTYVALSLSQYQPHSPPLCIIYTRVCSKFSFPRSSRTIYLCGTLIFILLLVESMCSILTLFANCICPSCRMIECGDVSRHLLPLKQALTTLTIMYWSSMQNISCFV